MSLKRYSIIAMMLAIAIVVGYVESFIPLFIPGFKLGLANVVIMIMLYEFKWYEALLVDVLRIIILGLIFGTIFNPIFFMSLAGGLLSYVVMLIFSRIKIFSIIGVSIIGAVSHSFGQIVVAIIILSLNAVIYYLPFIALFSLGCGIVSGIIARTYLKRSITGNFINNNKENEENV
ncbi:MAG: Gx transporter family protein [Acholeplasmatales bacterium]|nr:Gx transporter family protein [Acholeplasmatales bacterium]